MPSFANRQAQWVVTSRSLHIAIGIWVVVLWPACGDGEPPIAECAARPNVQPLYNASPWSTYLGADEASFDSTVALFIDVPEGEPAICTALMVEPGWALTAAHCADFVASSQLSLRRGPDAWTSSESLSVIETVLHPRLDLALLQVDAGGDWPSVFPALALEVPASDWLGAFALIVGFGEALNGDFGLREFLVEEITMVTEEQLRTSGRGRSGGCVGDSGAPLMLRDREGRLVVAGILSAGSRSCLGNDAFIRLEPVRDWLAEYIEVTPSAARCEQLDEAGRCFGATAVWCDRSGQLASESCADENVCGWDDAAAGFRCVPASASCAGFDGYGRCVGALAQRCPAGQLVEEDCAVCGRICALSADGRASCVDPP